MTGDAHATGERLAAIYERIRRTAMSGVPICNEALAVEAIGFRVFEGYAIGVVVTPWFANLIAAAQTENPDAFADATQLRLRFPAGDVDFNVSELAGFGRLASCSLFSPMSEFVDHAAARDAALAALAALFDPQLLDEPKDKRSTPNTGLDRRTLFGGRRRPDEGPTP